MLLQKVENLVAIEMNVVCSLVLEKSLIPKTCEIGYILPERPGPFFFLNSLTSNVIQHRPYVEAKEAEGDELDGVSSLSMEVKDLFKFRGVYETLVEKMKDSKNGFLRLNDLVILPFPFILEFRMIFLLRSVETMLTEHLYLIRCRFRGS